MQDQLKDPVVSRMVTQVHVAMTATRLEAAILDLQPMKHENKGTRLYELYPDAAAAVADVRAALAVAFLSCLCGRELSAVAAAYLPNFLSCLCGRELRSSGLNRVFSFLSCLCGREP